MGACRIWANRTETRAASHALHMNTFILAATFTATLAFSTLRWVHVTENCTALSQEGVGAAQRTRTPPVNGTRVTQRTSM